MMNEEALSRQRRRSNSNSGCCRKVAMMVPLIFCHGLFANSFQLSMVASRSSVGRAESSSARSSFKTQSLSSLIPPAVPIPASQGVGITSGLISQLAVAALKRRLKDQRSVACDVTANSVDLLLRGAVGPVTVRGRGWQSGGGLTCRAIEATVDGCDIDTVQVLSRQKLILKTPAQGRAMIALNEIDFANFITHPLIRPPRIVEPDGNAEMKSLQFLKDDVRIIPQSGAVTFTITYSHRKWKCQLQRGSSSSNRALLRVMPSEGGVKEGGDTSVVSLKLARSLSLFFNQMIFELDGTFLTFRDMMITDKGQSPSVMLSLNIKVTKFPSRNLAF